MFPVPIHLQSATVDDNLVVTTVHAYLIRDSIIMHMYMDKGVNLTLQTTGKEKPVHNFLCFKDCE